jgi:hypothetical protein
MNRRCSCSCTLHRRLHFRNCKGLGRLCRPLPVALRRDRAPFALYTPSARKFTIRNHCLRFGLYSCGETIPQRFNVTTFAIIRIIIISFPRFLKRAKTRIHYTVGDNYRTKTTRLLVATAGTLYIYVCVCVYTIYVDYIYIRRVI